MKIDQIPSKVRTLLSGLLPIAFGAYGVSQSILFFRILPPSKLAPAETFIEGIEYGLLYGWAVCSIFISTVGIGVVLSLLVANFDIDEVEIVTDREE